MTHDAHIVQKIRHGGDRDGEVTYYLVGPTRHILRDAHNDAAMMDPSVVHAEIDELRAYITTLEEQLDRAQVEISTLTGQRDEANRDRARLRDLWECSPEREELERLLAREEEARELLMSTLAEERGRGAVVRGAALSLYAALDALHHGGAWPPEIRAEATDLLAACTEGSPAAKALLELKAAAEEVRDRYEGPVEGWWGALDRLDAAVDRCREVKGGGPARESEIPEGGPE